MFTAGNLPRFAAKAHAKALKAGVENMTDSELSDWMDTLPREEMIAMMLDAKTLDENTGSGGKPVDHYNPFG